MRLLRTTLPDLQILDESAFSSLALWGELKRVLEDARQEFLVPDDDAGDEPAISWDRALFLNLTFYDPGTPSDVLQGRAIPADVVAHVAWHRLAHEELGSAPERLLLGEAIASAFDLYLVGRLLAQSASTSFLDTQVPAMAEVAMAAGLDEDAFEALLQETAEDPDAAFEDLRALLFDAAVHLVPARSPLEAAAVLAELDARRFAPLLHHYELSNWILAARAAGDPAAPPDDAARRVDRALREAKSSVEWLRERWVAPRLSSKG